MAFNLNSAVKILIISIGCLTLLRPCVASKDSDYNTLSVNPSIHDVSVIEWDGQTRYRRQSGNGSDTTSVPTGPITTTPTPSPSPSPSGTTEEVTVVDEDNHKYYTSRTVIPDSEDSYWIDLEGIKEHGTLSNSHRTAVTAKLSFQFKFYGHLIDNVTIATGGFLYMSPFIHKFLTATQYIAPLMANFDTRLGNTSIVMYKDFGFIYMSPYLHLRLLDTQYIAPLMADFDTSMHTDSKILFMDFGTKFVVEWKYVHLQGQNTSNPFWFQTILHANGSIVFVYKLLPLPMQNISTTLHPVKVGLSDAFYIDTENTGGSRKRTIYEYHRVTLSFKRIVQGSVTIFNPLPTCNTNMDCETCITHKTSFDCKWCGIINRCSNSVDWHRQEWLNGNCDKLAGKENCHLIPTAQPPQERKGLISQGVTIGIVIVVVVLVMVLIGAIGGWTYYAYTHPTSASGLWLMEHRPSVMKTKLSNMRFWKKSSGGGDKYAVESEA